MGRVFDIAGREIRVGSTVRRRFLDGAIGPSLGEVTRSGIQVDVWGWGPLASFATEHSGFARRRCPHLVVASTPDDFDPNQSPAGRSSTA